MRQIIATYHSDSDVSVACEHACVHGVQTNNRVELIAVECGTHPNSLWTLSSHFLCFLPKALSFSPFL